jgi:hypothetical protein
MDGRDRSSLLTHFLSALHSVYQVPVQQRARVMIKFQTLLVENKVWRLC